MGLIWLEIGSLSSLLKSQKWIEGCLPLLQKSIIPETRAIKILRVLNILALLKGPFLMSLWMLATLQSSGERL